MIFLFSHPTPWYLPKPISQIRVRLWSALVYSTPVDSYQYQQQQNQVQHQQNYQYPTQYNYNQPLMDHGGSQYQQAYHQPAQIHYQEPVIQHYVYPEPQQHSEPQPYVPSASSQGVVDGGDTWNISKNKASYVVSICESCWSRDRRL